MTWSLQQRQEDERRRLEEERRREEEELQRLQKEEEKKRAELAQLQEEAEREAKRREEEELRMQREAEDAYAIIGDLDFALKAFQVSDINNQWVGWELRIYIYKWIPQPCLKRMINILYIQLLCNVRVWMHGLALYFIMCKCLSTFCSIPNTYTKCCTVYIKLISLSLYNRELWGWMRRRYMKKRMSMRVGLKRWRAKERQSRTHTLGNSNQKDN